jgi:hypothetical protein
MKFDTHMTPEETRTAYNNVAQRSSSVLRDLGVSLVVQPPILNGEPYRGQLPDNLDILNNSELNNLLLLNVGYSKYLQTNRTQVSNELLVNKRKRASIRAAILKEGGKAHVDSDKRFINCDVEVCECECILAHIDTAVAAVKDAYKLLSRSVTIRGQELEASRAGNGWNSGGRSRGQN